ncbi:YfcE family phosphodiesterase [Clostridium chromiireducens]|uniref:Phosphoesterase n=1 Tax=Clostridium chromiireducens TaxID=225345 RepID=A0A964W4A8_9CLOT|nr:metallophosphoesterase family protein [Clostridium chromiireducens]MVX66336.1 YfcE family phosphodiesterase [Clostridium chromiireducens]
MRIAVISDIHSNILALESVLEDIKTKQVDLIVCLGDLVGYCTFPNEVINLIRERNIITIMGNYDEAVGNEMLVCGCDYPDPKDAENAGLSLNWTIDNVTEENKKFLRELPSELKLTFKGKNILFVHGSPRKINEYLKENSEEAGEVMEVFKEDVLVCAHTHKPYYKMYDNKVLINSGSTGKPKTGNPKANYVIIEVLEDVKVEIIEVAYDFEKIASAIEENELPKEFANIIRTGNA